MTKPKKKAPRITLKTTADYAKLFNDLGKIINQHDTGVTADDVLLDAKNVVVVIKLRKFGSMTLHLNRRVFDKSVKGLAARLIVDLARAK